jgi:hypothetical protein
MRRVDSLSCYEWSVHLASPQRSSLLPALLASDPVLLAWHGLGPDFSVYVGRRLRCGNPFPREDLFLTPTKSRLHCKMGTPSASVE